MLLSPSPESRYHPHAARLHTRAGAHACTHARTQVALHRGGDGRWLDKHAPQIINHRLSQVEDVTDSRLEWLCKAVGMCCPEAVLGRIVSKYEADSHFIDSMAPINWQYWFGGLRSGMGHTVQWFAGGLVDSMRCDVQHRVGLP